MKIKEHLTIIEQKDIINDISSDTGIEPKAIQDMLYSLRNTMEYYSKSATIGEDKNEKYSGGRLESGEVRSGGVVCQKRFL